MVKFTQDYINRFDEKVVCECCGKEMRRGQAACGFRDIVCVKCANN